jgi:hypothetical protein
MTVPKSALSWQSKSQLSAYQLSTPNYQLSMSLLPKLSALPLEISAKELKPYLEAGAPVLCLQIPSIGNLTPFRMRGRTNRTYRFEWDRSALCHVLRIPAALWAIENGALAKDIYQQMLSRPVIPVLELPGMPQAVNEPPPAKNVKRPPRSGTGKVPS